MLFKVLPSITKSKESKTSSLLIGALTPKFLDAINSRELNSGLVRVR